ncbi:MAG: hypothetical protein K2Y37_00275 [Pirellulales bacterium]|nr:hypothetical protein [Pirellulales bacterium]
MSIHVRTMLIVLIAAFGCVGCARHDSQQQAHMTLSTIGKALVFYRSQMGAFPPTIIRDSDGEARQSWRGLLIYHFESDSPRFNSRGAWNAPENLSLGGQPLVYYCDRKAKTNKTRYLAVTGDDCLMREGRPAPVHRLTAPLSEIGIVVDVGEQGIPWSQPGDLSLDELLERFEKRSLGPHSEGVLTLFADSSVRMVPYSTPIEQVRRMFTVEVKPREKRRKAT